MDHKYILAYPLTTNLQKQLLGGWCLGILKDKITEMSPTENMQMNQTILQLCLRTSIESTENEVLSVFMHTLTAPSGVYLHPSKSVIKGLVKKGLFSFHCILIFFFNASMEIPSCF